MKLNYEYKVYICDTDGSERKFGHVFAKSEAHAKVIAKSMGAKNITSAERVK